MTTLKLPLATVRLREIPTPSAIGTAALARLTFQAKCLDS
jgi:hypothetical protein